MSPISSTFWQILAFLKDIFGFFGFFKEIFGFFGNFWLIWKCLAFWENFGVFGNFWILCRGVHQLISNPSWS
jgi:hypothetical protein